MKWSDVFEAECIGRAVDAPDQLGGYYSLKWPEKEEAWRKYSAKLCGLLGEATIKVRKMNG